MCIDNNTIKEKTANRNIPVYKVFITPFNNYEDFLNYSLPFKHVNNLSYQNKLLNVISTISDKPGYHCFGSKELAKKYLEIIGNRWCVTCKTYKIIKMIIPKGTVYQKGKIGEVHYGNGMKVITTPKLINPVLIEEE